jgi:hypothetical protein
LLVSCVGSTGGELVTFGAFAAGPSDATDGQSLEFVNDRGWHVVLTNASLHVGAIYLNQSIPVSGAQNSSCILPGTYVAQVTTGMDVNLLSPSPQSFPTPGTGVTIPALAGQVWLTGGDVETLADHTAIVSIAGSADRGGSSFAFTGAITIAENRAPSDSSQLAGANPICKQRIVSPIRTSIELRSAGKLLLRIDPRRLFENVAFDPVAVAGGAYAFPDDSSDQPSRNLYLNLHSSAPYAFSWEP